MMSSPHVVLDGRGAVRHIPNETVRVAAIYDGVIEFDVVVRTNSRGLVDHREYPVSSDSRRHYAFVGDSFAYGLGAEPWVPKLRDAVRAVHRDIEIYNLGVNGASIQHYRRLVSSVAAELPLTHIVAIAITNDFYRPWWEPVATAEGTRLCRTDGAWCSRPPTLIDDDASAAELMARAEAIAADTSDRQQTPDPAWKRALWRSQLYLALRRRLRQVYHSFAPPQQPGDSLEHPRFLDVNLEALAGMRADFPTIPITLAHFPQKDEMLAGRYSLALEEHAAKLGMDFFPALSECSWSEDMYYRRDAHPNATGYQNFAQCLSRHLFKTAYR
jgi:hypothetical protein